MTVTGCTEFLTFVTRAMATTTNGHEDESSRCLLNTSVSGGPESETVRDDSF